MIEQIRSVMENYARLCIISLSNPPGRDSFSGPLRYHRSIIDAVQLRNGKRAAELIAKHAERSRGAIMRGLGGRAIVE
jgi:DNA-binding GntR family transcriptional regulator